MQGKMHVSNRRGLGFMGWFGLWIVFAAAILYLFEGSTLLRSLLPFWAIGVVFVCIVTIVVTNILRGRAPVAGWALLGFATAIVHLGTYSMIPEQGASLGRLRLPSPTDVAQGISWLTFAGTVFGCVLSVKALLDERLTGKSKTKGRTGRL